jgi:VanZ family protein
MDRSGRAARIAFALLLAFVTYASVTPASDAPGFFGMILQRISAALLGEARFGDKLGHGLAYAVLGAAAFFARLPPCRRVLWTPLALTVYGAVMEGAQALGGTRDPDIADAAVNAVGALAGVALARLFVHAFRRAAR